MAGEVWSLSLAVPGSSVMTRASPESAKIVSQGVLLHSSLPMGVRRGRLHLLRAYLALSTVALTAHKIVKGMRAGSNRAIKKAVGVEI